MAASTLSSKGQVTVPVEVRKRLGLRAGDQVEFAFEGGRAVLKPVRGAEDPFAEWAGIAPELGSLEEINRWIADMRDEDGAAK